MLPPLETPVTELGALSARRRALLTKLGLHTVHDCLEYYPRDYLDRRKMVTLDRAGYSDDVETVEAEVVNHLNVAVRRPNAPKVAKVILYDGQGLVALVGFGKRAGYLKISLPLGAKVVVSGKFKRVPRTSPPVETTKFEYEVLSDEDAELIHTGRLVPVYRTTADLPQRALRTLIAAAIREHLQRVPEVLPEGILRAEGLMPRVEALRQIHYPESEAALEEARRRLVFEELFLLQLGLLIRRHRTATAERGISFRTDGRRARRLLDALPFALTDAQARVIREIEADMRSPHPMNRLLQGDVGSGKTVVAAVALAHAAESGHQGALMAPTEILAEQHVESLREYLDAADIEPVLLKGDMSAPDKRDALERIGDGRASLVVGTHALIEEEVHFQSLGLVITDEQHRFGVLQREKLRTKGHMPDVLVMTATPIPRTLALTAYGDLAVSVIDELPPGRTPVQTKHFREADRDHLYRFLDGQLAKGRQAYVVYPLVEESEKLEDVQAAAEAWERMSAQFPHRRVGLLHGRLPSEAKQDAMRRFKAGELDILVATTVVEVGVDVPNANVMFVENVERYGLAQLHQLRGRVGRGEHPSYCALVGEPRTDEGRRRVEVLVRTTDGFEIAEEDLAIRGPGDILGTRQAGLPDFKIASLLRDGRILDAARSAAQSLLDGDAGLRAPEHLLLRETLVRHWRGRLRLASIG
jgi:ATP-dependent DNA helicase RecG